MPMTLKRYVNGQVVPIKLSILDAFRTSPPPRKKKGQSSTTSIAPSIASSAPNPTTASSAPNTTINAAPNPTPNNAGVVLQTSVPASVTATASETVTKNVNNAKKDNPITKQGEDEAHTFTAADDAKLIEMKAAGKTWKEIVAETKKSQSASKERFKEIGPKPDVGAGDDAGNEQESEAKAKERKESEAKSADEKKMAEAQSQKSSSTGKTSKQENSNASEATAKSTTSTSTSTSKPSTSMSKSKFSTTSTAPTTISAQTQTQPQVSLAEIAAKYERDKWRFAASRYYDLTGIRISKEEARRMVEAGQ